MSNKEKILDLYYNQHLKQNEIAKIVDTTTQYVSKVVRTDKRNKEEKEKRKKKILKIEKFIYKIILKLIIDQRQMTTVQKYKNRCVYSY